MCAKNWERFSLSITKSHSITKSLGGAGGTEKLGGGVTSDHRPHMKPRLLGCMTGGGMLCILADRSAPTDTPCLQLAVVFVIHDVLRGVVVPSLLLLFLRPRVPITSTR